METCKGFDMASHKRDGTQRQIFIHSEGDRWFARNRDLLRGAASNLTDQLIQLVQQHVPKVHWLLDLGGANGHQAYRIVQKTAAEAIVVDVSEDALVDGISTYPALCFVRGSLDRLPLHGGFDLVVVSFVLHWVDRSLLFASIAEIDRMVADRGYLVVADFSPDLPTRVPYHHLPRGTVWTFKQDYAQLFLQSQLYELVDEVFGSHGPEDGMRSETRTAVKLLRKTCGRHSYEG